MRGRLFVGFKPLFISSNNYLAKLKKELGIKRAGYSGTLDPFAVGVLLIGTDGASKLFNYLRLEPKSYRAVLWLGAKSDTLDIEGVSELLDVKPIEYERVKAAVEALKSVTKIIPPRYSAKRINGKRAYELARENRDVELKECDIKVFDAKLIGYSHPFVTFEVSVSKGTYVRTLGELAAKSLGVCGALSYLERLSEGEFLYSGGDFLDIKKSLATVENSYKKDKTDIIHGKKLDVNDFEITNDGLYHIERDGILSIIEIKDGNVIYKLNNIEI